MFNYITSVMWCEIFPGSVVGLQTCVCYRRGDLAYIKIYNKKIEENVIAEKQISIEQWHMHIKR